jgi:hypothetical protein
VSERWRNVGRVTIDVIGGLMALGAIALVVAPIFMKTDTYGVHDWDQMQAHRYLAVKTIKRFHQFPFWNPYSCGGHTWWGGLESGSSLVSPALPFYLFAPFTWALRLEVVLAALISGVGTWLLAGRFTKSAGLRLIAVAAFAVDGRFSEQASVGHTWHLYYAWMPWALYFLDRAIGMAPSNTPPKALPLRDIALTGAMIAMMVYTGAIYPLPQTILVVALYAIGCAIASRSIRPVAYAVFAGILSLAFAAPRLLPVMDMMRRYPRLVDSPEALDLSGFIAVFTSKEGTPRPPIGPWGWHEWGIYTGWVPLILMLVGLAFAARGRERALRLTGAVCLVLGFGRFHDWSPWGLAHDYLPIFESQHVPSRWLYPATLVLVVAAGGILERFLRRQPRRLALEVALLSLGAYVGLDVGLEAQRPLVGAFARHLAPLEERVTDFHQERTAPPSMRYDAGEWAPPNMPSMIANVGVLDCNTFPGFNSYYRDKQGHSPGMGAIPRGDPAYRGETFTSSGTGTTNVESWSPNAVTVSVHGGRPGDLLVLNQNWDPGWRANGASVVDYRSAIAAPIHDADEVVTFRFVPRFFGTGCLLLVAAVVGLVWLSRGRRQPKAVL